MGFSKGPYIIEQSGTALPKLFALKRYTMYCGRTQSNSYRVLTRYTINNNIHLRETLQTRMEFRSSYQPAIVVILTQFWEF